jgi:ribonuclease HII
MPGDNELVVMLPTFKHESQYWEQGIGLIAGIDEAGMGALAGPVVAGAVVFSSNESTSLFKTQSPNKAQNTKGQTSPRQLITIRDSKLMAAGQRERAAEWIKEKALVWAVGEASVEEIDRLNIRRASHLAMGRAVDALAVTPNLLLVDGTPAQPHRKIPAVNIIGGDRVCFSIAAAGILAKVHRDKIMTGLDKKYAGYGWVTNKGYGSLKHRLALKKLGVTEHHRRKYAPVAKCLT